MKVTVWGSRGSLASAGPETIRYGGNTACVQVEGDDGSVFVLDAGTGMRRAGLGLAGQGRPVHILLTHLHMDHIQGLGFFRPLFEAGREIHVWGPPSTTQAGAADEVSVAARPRADPRGPPDRLAVAVRLRPVA